eukprot:Seg753.2 transcript_id=Seg753.2/GoldUCD/mRNA.D3Y31 product="Retrovirus-related Pol polyprotein from transposon 412" pseudo=true protein_id=Seg753.2/GoldUCD/D3Y31
MGRLGRWALSLQSYDFEIRHRAGKQHGNADALSRKPEPGLAQEEMELTAVNALHDYDLDLEAVKTLQRRDELLGPLIVYMQTGELPESNVKARQLVAMADNYVLDNNILYHLQKPPARFRSEPFHYFKWVECFALSDIHAPNIAKIYAEEIVCRHSAARELLSDRGKNFLAKIVVEVCKLVNTAKINTTSYRPQCNGLTERFNHTLTTMLSMYVSQHHDDWDTYIPYALFAYRTAIHDTTKESPFFLMYGRDPHLPIDVILLPRQEHYDNVDDYRTQVVTRLNEARKLAKNNIELFQQCSELRRNKAAELPSFEVGQKVWIFTPNNRKGLSAKLVHNWHGPYRIVEKCSSVNFRLENGDIVHSDRLKDYIEYKQLSDHVPEDLITNENDDDVVSENETEAVEDELVDQILDKRRFRNRAGRLVTHYLIKWKDNNLEDSWEPEDNFMCQQLLKEFEDGLKNKKMQ